MCLCFIKIYLLFYKYPFYISEEKKNENLYIAHKKLPQFIKYVLCDCLYNFYGMSADTNGIHYVPVCE